MNAVGAPTQSDWSLESLRAALTARIPGFAVEAVDAIDSTNTELMRRSRAAQSVPTLLVARHQHAGRGRLGRSWQGAVKSAADVAASNPGALTFSLALPLAPLDWSGLSLAVGVAVAEGLEAVLPAPVTTSSIQLKWPNDLWLGDAKLGGILIETGPVPPQASASKTARFVVVGIGLNIGAPPAGDYRTPPACLRQLWPDATAVAALSAIAVPMLDALLAFGASGFAPFASRFACRDLLLGRELALSDGSTGIGDGLAADGALRLRRADGSRHEVRSDEVSVRPVGSGAAHLPTTFHAAVSGQATKEPVGEAQEPARDVIAAGARRGA